MEEITIGFIFGLFVAFFLCVCCSILEPDSNTSKKIVTEIATNHVVLDDCFYIEAKPPKTLQIGDTVNFFTN